MDTLVQDPVCGTNLNPINAVGKYLYKGQTYYLCSLDCTIIFDEEPEKYAGGMDVDFPFEEEEE